MKTFLKISLGIVLGGLGLPLLSSAAGSENGGLMPAADVAAAKAPVWSITDLDGKKVSSESLKGNVVVVDFWATWCGPCVAEIPGYVNLQKKYADKGLRIVGLSVDEGGEGVVRKFVAAKNMSYTVGLATDEIMETFGGFEAIPTTFVLDRNGKVRYHKVGAMREADFEAILKPLLGE